MNKKLHSVIILLFSCIILFGPSCGKDSNGPEATLVVSPVMLVDMMRKNWDDVQPELKNKKGYWYSEFPSDQNGAIKAAVSLPAFDESTPDKEFTLLLNVQRGSNRITVVSLSLRDSVKLSQQEAYALMQHYYEKALKPLTDTSYTYCSYSLNGEIQQKTTLVDILSKINSNFDAYNLNINYNSSKGSFIMSTFTNAAKNYSFSFDGFTN